MEFASNLALVSQDERLTYSELDDLAASIATPVPERSVVFLVASNTIASIAAYVGFLRKRVVVVMIRDESTSEQFKALVSAYSPQYIWAPVSFEPLMGTGYDTVMNNRGYQLFATGYFVYEINPDTALLLTTSGSTGTPKFVRLSYENLRSNAESIVEYQRITSGDRAITTLPFSYTYGISIVNSHLLAGASIVVTEASVMSRAFWDLLRETEATNFGGVPYTYQMLKRLRFGRMDLPSLRFISQAGGRLGETLQEEFGRICADKDIDFFVMYGQTEATARMSWLPPERVLDKLGSIGIAIPGGTFELRDANDGVIEQPDVAGELVYRGANVSQGYATCKDDLAFGDERGGVLHTGDVAKRDEDGFYYVVGRMKRFLKMFGNRVNMDELEAIFAKRGIEMACIGSDDNMAVFTTSDDVDALLAAIAAETKLNPHGFSVHHIDEIPHTSSGKVDYVSLEGLC